MSPSNKSALKQDTTDLLSQVSHELRTPLTVIHGYLESLLEISVDDSKKLKKIFQQMFQHSQRMTRTIEDLLLLSRFDNHLLQEKKEIINVADLLKELAKEARDYSSRKKHRIHLAVKTNVSLQGDGEALKSLFSNIIINAVKYTPAEGSIRIEWYLDEDQRGVFRVTDTGIGIEKKYLPMITERFFRAPSHDTRVTGLGLGLAIAKEVLTRHQGELHIESEWQKGSIFTCVFSARQLCFA